MKHMLRLSCLAILLLAPISKPVAKQSVKVWNLAHLPHFMARYRKFSTPFSRYRFSTSAAALADPNFNFWAAQMAATDASFMGRPNDALGYFPIAGSPPELLPDSSHYHAVDASAWIVNQAYKYRIVMINEAHHIPQTRLLTKSLLKPLYDQGFRYLALETLENNDKHSSLNKYPRVKSGGYTGEPIMAEMMREALRLGYTLVPYEAPPELVDKIEARERTQARNLARFLDAHPDARLLVHAGYAHIAKTSAIRIGGARTMATNLISMTHAKVLSIDQTKLMPMSLHAHAAIDAQIDLDHAFDISGPVVLISHHGGFAWSAAPGAYDASVLLPHSPSDVIRPDWLSLGGIRRKVYVGAEGCAKQFPCLVQAFVVGEPKDATPADQFVFQVEAESHTPLFLSDGQYRLRYTTYQDQVTVDRRMDVPDRMGDISPVRTR